MSEKPRLLVIAREPCEQSDVCRSFSDRFEVIQVRTVARAIARLQEGPVSGVFVDAAQLPEVRWFGILLQADEILDAIADGVAVIGPDRRIIWTNPEFRKLTGLDDQLIGLSLEQTLGLPAETMAESEASRNLHPVSTLVRLGPCRSLRVSVTPIVDAGGVLTHSIVLTHDVTAEVLQQQKIDALHEAGQELADLTPDELAEMGVEDRKAFLRFHIIRHMKELLGLDFIEIRLLEPATNRLVPLVTVGMTPLTLEYELHAEKQGNGVSGYVAATGKSYLCPDTAIDPLYMVGAAGTRSSLTVPLFSHGAVIGTLNVESPHPNAFDDRDRQFVEIYARNVATAVNTFELLDAEKRQTGTASVEAFQRELALPIDSILSDATTVLDRYDGHDDEVISRLKHLVSLAGEIRGLISKVGSSLAPGLREPSPRPPRFAQTRLLVADAEESVRRAMHAFLGPEGATVETVRSAKEALSFARQYPYSAAIVDIRLPDMSGYDVFRRLREVQPGLPIILMTGFGYDPSHAIVKARQEGLQSVLYKPFRADRLLESVEQALRAGGRAS